jgi:signal transduction histidine kinase
MELMALPPVRVLLAVLVFVSATKLALGSEITVFDDLPPQQRLEPSRLNCDAKYSTPCARTNVEWLAVTTAQDIEERLARNSTTLQVAWDAITHGDHNMERNFYPFVFDKQTGVCVAHGAASELVGLTLRSMFELVGSSFSDPDAAMERMYATSDKGGGWVQYVWSDGSGGHHKISYVINVTDRFLLGVGYEGNQLPRDLPCSAKHDSWCSITNVISLLGSAQSLLFQAESLSQFESAAYELSFNQDYQIEGGFYVFMYSFKGILTSHALIHDFLGKSFADVIVSKGLGTNESAWALHRQFIAAANGENGGWTRYDWKNADDEVFTKVAVIAKIDVQGEWYYIGSGFDFNCQAAGKNDNSTMGTTVVRTSAPMLPSEPTTHATAAFEEASSQSVFEPISKPCTQNYNTPCSFQTALQLTSHALVHAVTSPTSEEETWRTLAEDGMFHSNDFYVFVVRCRVQHVVSCLVVTFLIEFAHISRLNHQVDFNGTITAHGMVPEYRGKTVWEVFEKNRVPLDGKRVHDQFRRTAEQGGGWVLYDWIVPGVEDSVFQKVSYIFQIKLNGRRYYGGVGFNDKRAPLEIHTSSGTKMNGEPVTCSQNYGTQCSDNNVCALLGEAFAELTLAASNARVTNSAEDMMSRSIDQILNAINEKDADFTVNDFYVSVFHVDPFICEDDESGCCVAHGSDRTMVGKNWQQILDEDRITSITGRHLHKMLTETSNKDSGTFDYLYSQPTGDARTKRAVVAKFKGTLGEDLYVMAEYFRTPPPPTCDNCPKNEECKEATQSYCEVRIDDTSRSPVPWIIALILLMLFSVGGFFWYRHRNWKKRQILAKRIQKMEEEMKGIVEIVHNTGVQITSAQDYRDNFGTGGVLGWTARPHKHVKVVWCWEENAAFLPRYNASSIIPRTNFVTYQESVSSQIELAFQRWKEGRGFKEFRVDLTNKVQKIQNRASGAQFVIDFEAMTQRNLLSEHKREIRRHEYVVEELHSGVVDQMPRLPASIDFFGENGEDFLPTFEGQIIQVSKETCDCQWLYGSVLYDPLLADAQNTQNGNLGGTDGLNRILSVALHDKPTSGWFPAVVSKPADVKVMKNLLHALGGDGIANLKPPGTWEPNKEGCIPVGRGTDEYRAVAGNFLAALYDQAEHVTVVGVERVQCTPLWQSYAVKKETMKIRDGKCPENRVNNHDPGVERKWLFHGTAAEAIPKIVKQGFNRAFAGRNAVAFGKGVYFARDASYSSHRAYSTPDSQQHQHMFMCRVAVGDWCQGKNGQLTPDPKPRNPLELFDSTVDNVIDPAVFVSVKVVWVERSHHRFTATLYLARFSVYGSLTGYPVVVLF